MSKFLKIYVPQILSIVSLIIIFSCFNFSSTEPIQHHLCSSIPSNTCKVLNVTVHPCPEALENEPCNLYRGTNSTVEIYYIPKFSGSNLTTQRYSTVLFIDIPDPYTDRDACKFTRCPTEPGKVHLFNYTFPILDTFPTGVYSTKWKLWNEAHEECCFTTPIIIV